MFVHLPAATRHHIDQGSFIIDRIRPGLGFDAGRDLGFGPIGLIDHAILRGGAFIGLHEHRNDEIVSYIKRGTMYHFDNERGREELRSDRIMVMNAGSSMWHEEQVPPGQETVEMLQIFLRPRALGLPPILQIKSIESVKHSGEWRNLVAPEEALAASDASFFVRSAVWLYDTHLDEGMVVPLPSKPGFDGWLYVFDGLIAVAGHELKKGDALAMVDESVDAIKALGTSDLVLFLVNRSSTFTRQGTLSA